MKTKIINAVLWLAFLLAMAASAQHLAWVFGTVERPGWQWLGWIPAVAVDTGLAALAYTIQQRARAKRPTKILWAGVVGFAAISALANLYHALSVEAVALAESYIVYAKALVLSATLPAMYIFLGEIISGDDATAAEKAARQSEREQRRLDLAAERETAEAKRLLLEAEHKQTEADPKLALTLHCKDCERTFSSFNALNAHMRVHANGKIVRIDG